MSKTSTTADSSTADTKRCEDEARLDELRRQLEASKGRERHPQQNLLRAWARRARRFT
jgi:hypothetical protein